MSFYTHADFWRDPVTGDVWHALKRIGPAGVTDLSMGLANGRDGEKTLAWARTQQLVIADRREMVR
jgi:hypothetical protein